MLFSTPPPSRAVTRQLEEFDRAAERLRGQSGAAGPWLGRLRRQWRAESAHSSIAIEGFSVPEGERVAITAGEQSPGADDENRRALACYAHAMHHVTAMADDAGFRYRTRVILDLHFDACSFQRDKRPGRFRKEGIAVTDPHGGATVAFTGPPEEDVAPLVGEIVDWLEHGDLDAHVAVRAAMAHLHLISVHPFEDGNGRASRILQSLVLARAGALAGELLSIEEYLGRNTDAYYAVLQKVQGGGYHADRDASPWIRFCVEAHLDEAARRLSQVDAAARRWRTLEEIVEARRWPDRLVIALEQSLFGGTDRARYGREADISTATASNDLRRLVDAGLIVQRGQGRTTRYVASDELDRRSGSGV